MRVLLDHDPMVDFQRPHKFRGQWPAQWIAFPGAAGKRPGVFAFRRFFTLDEDRTLRIHVSADERYELFLNGKRVGRGPERGDPRHWCFETYQFELAAGRHVIVARTWWLGDRAPYAQHGVRQAFMLAAGNMPPETLNTGTAAWDCRRMKGYFLLSPGKAWGTGARLRIRAADFPWGFERGTGSGWSPALVIGHAESASVNFWRVPEQRRLRPSLLPAMIEKPRRTGRVRHVQAVSGSNTIARPVRARDHLAAEAPAWDRLLKGENSLRLPPFTTRRVIIDLGEYYCAWPEITTSGGLGSRLRVLWAEALFEQPRGTSLQRPKGHRDEIEGKYFDGVGDVFETDGGRKRKFETLWWEPGRYLEVLVSTGREPLTIDSWLIRETGYPLKAESRFGSAGRDLAGAWPIMLRGLRMCAHETYMDCPYYEQLQYVGDTRLEALTTYALTGDDRLPRKAIMQFDESREETGLTTSRHPSRERQVIPPFSLWWVAMVHDYALWRNDPAFIAARMPGVRAVLDHFRSRLNPEGLLEAPIGWNFVDWVPGWYAGMPGGADLGVSSILNAQLTLVLRQAAELEEWLCEPELAARNRRTADGIAEQFGSAFWDQGRGMYADDSNRTNFSEHAQCLSLLAGLPSPEQQARVVRELLSDPDLSRTTIYFSHYLFETYRVIGRMDRFFERLDLWFKLKSRGFKTTPEMPEPSRSDCHGWGAHPIFHSFASVMGIRPAAPGFRRVEIAPQPGPLPRLAGRMVHPRGFIRVDLTMGKGSPGGEIELPAGVPGIFRHEGDEMTLKPGTTRL